MGGLFPSLSSLSSVAGFPRRGELRGIIHGIARVPKAKALQGVGIVCV